MASTTFDLKTFLLSHAVWVVAIAVGLIVGHVALQEHDARIAAEAQIKTSEAAVATLQQQIAQTNAQAAQKVQVVTKIVHDLGPAPTPTQVVAAVPELTNVPLNARPAVDNSAQISVDAVPFVNFLAQAKTDQINLGACQSDLKNETAIAAQKDIEIKALKKKPSFWKTVKKDVEFAGVVLSIGALLGAHL
jgi:hypothetical protein